MGSGVWFWIILVVCAVFGFPGNTLLGPVWGPRGSWLVWVLLFGILGWHDFGPPIHMQ